MRRLLLYGVIIFQIALIISLVRGIQLSKRSVSRIANMQETKEKLQMEQGKLKEQSEYVQSPYYLEKVARDELSMAKIGETVVIIPDRSEEIRSEKGELKSELQKPNWQKWWEVLSGIE